MTLRPPPWSERLIAWAFRDDPALPAILGDLREELAREARRAGPAAARRWYAREALLLTAGRAARAPLHVFFGTRLMHDAFLRPLRQDAAYAWRSLRRSPGFALFAALIIGLGVGATTAVFSVLRPFLLAPLPFEDADRLVWVSNDPGEGNESLSAFTSRSGNLRDFRRETRSFEGLTGYNAFFAQGSPTLTGVGEPERLTGVGVAHDFLDVIGVDPLVGRSFTREEGLWDGPPAIILGHGFWVRRFGADPGLVGSAVTLDGEPRTVVGVLPPGFDFSAIFSPGTTVDFLEPFAVADETDRWGNTMFFVGRLRPGVSAEAAQADLDAVVASLQEVQPDRWGLGAVVTPLREHFSAPYRSAFGLLVAAAATVLLIVSVNLSNLLLARMPTRSREVAVRKAFGAPRGRIIRHLLFETAWIGAGGAVVGAVLAVVAVRLAAGAAVTIPFLDRMEVDLPAFAFGTVVAVGTGMLAGLLPALRVADGTEAGVLRSGGRGSGVSRGARRLREGLVISEVALACALLVVGGLLLRSFRAVTEIDLGFEADGAVVWKVKPSAGFESRQAMADHYGALVDRIGRIPGVMSVGLIDRFIMGQDRTWGAFVPGLEDPTDGEGHSIFPHMVDAGFFDAMDIRVVDGRAFTADDRTDAEPVLVVNQTAARRFFGDADPLGRAVRAGGGDPRTVVGVVEDIRHSSPDRAAGAQVYFPMAQMWDFQDVDMVLRSGRSAADLLPAVAAAFGETDAAMPTREFFTVRSRVDDAVSPRRFTLSILAAYGSVALLLAGLGIYGVLAQSVAERRPELGIRMALGATSGEILRSVLGRTLTLAGIGIAVGALLSLWGGRFLQSMLYGVEATDPLTFLGMAVVLLAVAAAAGGLPAWRAASTRGIRALRSE